jgi:FAD/FMN-containing dehydrogenase
VRLKTLSKLAPLAPDTLISRVDYDGAVNDDCLNRIFKYVPEEYVDYSKDPVVLHPRETHEVASILEAAHFYKQKILLTYDGEIDPRRLDKDEQPDGILDLRRLKKRIHVDEKNLVVTVTASVSFDEVRRSLQKHPSVELPLEPLQENPLSVGKWVDEGMPCFGSTRHGLPADAVRDMVVVLPTGVQMHTGFRRISNFAASFDLNHLFEGHEGTLCAVAEVSLELRPTPPRKRTLELLFDDWRAAGEAVRLIARAPYAMRHVSAWDPGMAVRRRGVLVRAYLEGVPEVVDLAWAGLLKSLEPLKPIVTEGDRRPFGVGQNMEERWPVSEVLIPLARVREFADLANKMMREGGIIGFLSGTLVHRNCVAFRLQIPTTVREELVHELLLKLADAVFKMEGSATYLDFFSWSYDVDDQSIQRVRHLWQLKKGVDPAGVLVNRRLDRAVKMYVEWVHNYVKSTSRFDDVEPNIFELQEKAVPWSLKELLLLAAPMAPLAPSMNTRQKREFMQYLGSHVSVKEADRIPYAHDIAALPDVVGMTFKTLPDAVVLAHEAEDVQVGMRLANRHYLPVTPRGGGSSGIGGVVPTQGGVVMDTSKLRDVEELDEENMVLHCGSGYRWEQADDIARKAGLRVGAYPSSAKAATLGGWVSTNGAGLCSYRNGIAYDQVVSLHFALWDGYVGVTGPVKVPNCGLGPDLVALYAGAEGTIGVITRVTLRLQPKEPEIRALSYGFESVELMQASLQKLSRSAVSPLHVSFLDTVHQEMREKLGLEAKTRLALLNVVLDSAKDVNDAEEKVVDSLVQGAQKQDAKSAAREWEERKYEFRQRRLGPGGILAEGIVAIGKFGAMARDTSKARDEMHMIASLNGVVIDRNTVLFYPWFLADESSAMDNGSSLGFVKRMTDVAESHGGRSAGIGLWLSSNLFKFYGKAGAYSIREIKKACDPRELVNPGKHGFPRLRFGLHVPAWGIDLPLDTFAMLRGGLPKFARFKMKEQLGRIPGKI